jgi:3-hydroxyisobutyrate dehydrogenase-like beta-hydroxyacid dehydrogenase
MTHIAVIGFGAMGAAIARVLSYSGAKVVTTLEGRSAETHKRAKAAGIRDVRLAAIADADLILSIVPPVAALEVAHQVAEAIQASASSALYVDCNAVSPETMAGIANTFGDQVGRVFDGCIIGGPPMVGRSGPHIYVSDGGGRIVETLVSYGLDARLLNSGIGSASALKMCYAGINKGLIGLGTAMLVAAAKSGADKALMGEMAASQSELVAKFATGIPDMYPKAHRWVAEMREIASFLGSDNPASAIFLGMEGIFEQMAADRATGGELATAISGILEERT